MIKFGQRLAEYIEERGTNQYQLAQQAGVDRPTLNKVIKGVRVPSSTMAEKIFLALALTPAEQNELRELMAVEHMGVAEYRIFNLSKQLVESIGRVQRPVMRNGHSERKVTLPPSLANEPVGITVGTHAVNNLIKDLAESAFYSETGLNMCIDCPLRYDYLLQLLGQLYCIDEAKVHIQQVVCFEQSTREKSTISNMEELIRLLPFALSASRDYSAYYYFDPAGAAQSHALFPYYLIIGEHLVLLSGDFDRAMLINNSEVLAEFRADFTSKIKRDEPIRLDFYSAAEAVRHIDSNSLEEDVKVYMIYGESATCMIFDADEICSHARTELPGIAEAARLLNARFKRLHAFDDYPYEQCFSLSALEKFCECGVPGELPAAYFRPFDTGEMIEYVERLEKRIRTGYAARAVDESRFTIPRDCAITYYEGRAIHFELHRCSGSDIRTAVIYEHGIVDAFGRFATGLLKSDLVLSKEKTLEGLQAILHRLRLKQQRQVSGDGTEGAQ